MSRAYLFLEYLFNLANLFLHLAADLFILAFSRHVGVVRGSPDFFFSGAFGFVKLAFDLIGCARFHVFLFVVSGLQPACCQSTFETSVDVDREARNACSGSVLGRSPTHASERFHIARFLCRGAVRNPMLSRIVLRPVYNASPTLLNSTHGLLGGKRDDKTS
jgi:hypothetical protein